MHFGYFFLTCQLGYLYILYKLEIIAIMVQSLDMALCKVQV